MLTDTGCLFDLVWPEGQIQFLDAGELTKFRRFTVALSLNRELLLLISAVKAEIYDPLLTCFLGQNKYLYIQLG